jgi:hypothetical protein
VSDIPSRWTYGEEGSAYPVRPGELWSCGSHVFRCLDLEQENLLKGTLGSWAPCRVAYIDPPWTDSLATGFRTKAGDPHKVELSGFLERLIRALDWAGVEHLGIEMGMARHLTLDLLLKRDGWELDWYPIIYGPLRPAMFAYAARPGITRPYLPVLQGLSDDHTPYAWLKEVGRDQDIVLDLCAGRGLTALSAQDRGMGSRNVELHPHRMSAALERLRKAGAGKVEWVG